MPAARRRLSLAALASLAALTALAVLPSVEAAPKQAASCYAFDLTTRGGNFGRAISPLRSNALVGGSGSLYGVLHVCGHGILFPRTVWIASARYYLDDPLHRRPPIGLKRSVAPFRLALSKLKPGRHSLSVVVSFRGAGGKNFRSFVATKRFRVAARKPAKPKTAKARKKIVRRRKPGTKLFVPRFGQCGGSGAKCGRPGRPCTDKRWPNSACIGGRKCRRKSKFYWQCL